MPVSTGWLIVLLGAHIIAGIVLGWWACAIRPWSRPSNGFDRHDREAACRHVQWLLDAVCDLLDRHAETLEAFRMTLGGGDGLSSNRNHSHHFEDALISSGVFEVRLDKLINEWNALGAEAAVDDSLLSRLTDYRTQTNQFRNQLRQCADARQGAEALQAVVALVRGLLDSNGKLQNGLADARRRLVEQQQRLSTAEREARTDPLTKLPNRRAFEERLHEALSFFHRHADPLALVIVDVDRFKDLNDTCGHAAGDAALEMLARILCDTARVSDHVSRLGGEEFAVLLPHTHLAGALLMAERLRSRIEHAILEFGGRRLSITVSLGVAEAQPGDEPSALTARSDEALYAAKQSGRNRVCRQGQTLPVAEAPEAPSERYDDSAFVASR